MFFTSVAELFPILNNVKIKKLLEKWYRMAMCFCAPGNVRVLCSNCKSKMKSIYVFIFCHLDICAGLGSTKKGVPFTNSLADLSYCHKVLNKSEAHKWPWRGGPWSPGPERLCWECLGGGAGAVPPSLTRKPQGLFMGAESSRSIS